MKNKFKIVTSVIVAVLTLCIAVVVLTKAEASEVKGVKYETDKLDKIVDNRLVTIGSHKDKTEVTIFRNGTAKVINKDNSIYEYKISDEAMAMINDMLSRDEFKDICGDMKECNYYISYKENNKIYFCTTDSLDNEKQFNRVYTIVMKLAEQKQIVLA